MSAGPSRAASAAVMALLLAVAAVITLIPNGTGDYLPAGPLAAGNSAPSILALLDGDVGRFFSAQPLLGPVSLLLRAPFAGVAQLLGGGELVVYRAGAFACLLGPVLLGWHLFRVVARRGGPAWQGIVLALLCVANPLTVEGVSIGHPEEALAGALVVGAVLVVPRHAVGGGVLAGLAVATKQWALLAVPVAIMAAPGRRVAVTVAAGVVAACLLVPMTLADPDASQRVRDEVLDARTANLLSVWYPVVPVERVPGYAPGSPDHEVRRLPFGLSRSAVAPLIVAIAAVLALLLWRRSGPGGPEPDQTVALLAALLILRCVLDPWNLEYYAAASLMAICAWEALARTGLPLISILYAAGAWTIYGPLLQIDGDTLASVVYLALSALFVGYMALAAFAPARIDRGRVGSAT